MTIDNKTAKAHREIVLEPYETPEVFLESLGIKRGPSKKASPQTLKYEVPADYAFAVRGTLFDYFRRRGVAASVNVEHVFADDPTATVYVRLITTENKLGELRSDIDDHYSFG